MFIHCFLDSSPKYELKELCISHLLLNNSSLKRCTYMTSQQLTDSAIQVLFRWVLGFQKYHRMYSTQGCSVKDLSWGSLENAVFHDWSCSSSLPVGQRPTSVLSMWAFPWSLQHHTSKLARRQEKVPWRANASKVEVTAFCNLSTEVSSTTFATFHFLQASH